jgi:hypothetical protein
MEILFLERIKKIFYVIQKDKREQVEIKIPTNNMISSSFSN